MSSDERFVPFSKRRAEKDERAAFLEPRDGVPDYLNPSLRGWLDVALRLKTGGHKEYVSRIDPSQAEALVSNLERTVEHRFPQGSGASETLDNVLNDAETDADLCLDLVDALLPLFDGGARHFLSLKLQDILDEAGSLFTVSSSEASIGLEERVGEAMRDVAHNAMEGEARPAEHLRNAWTAAFARGNQERASEAYRGAVRAIESALRPIASPNNDRATLGTMIRDIKQAPQNFSMRLDGLAGDSAVTAFAEHLNQLWKGQLDRHGTDDEATPISVTPEQAKDAVVFAVSIVQVLQTGGFSRREP